MRHFIKLCEIARDVGVYTYNRDLTKFPLVRLGKDATQLLSQVQPIVFFTDDSVISSEEPAVLMKKPMVEGIDFDPPFPFFSIEKLSGFLMRGMARSNVVEFYVWCMAAFEPAPNQFHYLALMSSADSCHVYTMNADHGLVAKFLKKINSENIGSVNSRTIIKLGHGADKFSHRIRKIVYVGKKNETLENPSLPKDINWSHRWWVRGHWRKVEGLGKNREGQHCTPGFTWVTEHVKGPEEMVIVNKVRAVGKSA